MKKLVLFLSVFCLVFTSCEKSEEDKAPIEASKSKFLMDGSWQIIAYTVLQDVNDFTGIPQDVFTPLPNCEKDDYFIFQSESNLVRYEGEEKCSVIAPDSVEFFYSLNNDETRISIWGNNEDRENSMLMDAEIEYPSINEFKLTYHYYDESSKLTSEHVQVYRKN